jgi:glucuronoarabinoxylan endo-1,4-beta-xylanase
MMIRLTKDLLGVALLVGALVALKADPVIAQAAQTNQAVSVDVNSVHQTIAGFGACSAWSGTMSPAQASALFGTLGFSLWRVRIDPGGHNADEAGNVTIAHSYGAKVLATPWTPPASMKSNNSTIGGSLNPIAYAAYAAYLNNAMSQLGADDVSLQNEPDAKVTYESCFWTGAQMDAFLDQEGANIHFPIVMPEAEGFNPAYSDPALNDPAADSHIAIIAGHLYGTHPTTYTNALSHGKPVWMTEHFVGSGPNAASDITNALTLAQEIDGCMDNNMSAYFWWWAYFKGGRTDLLQGDTIQTSGYVLGQWAKFVRPGFVRVDAPYSPQSGVFLNAFTGKDAKGKDEVVVIAVNTDTSLVNQTIAFLGANVSACTPCQTDASESMAMLAPVKMSKNTLTVTLPAQSVTTFTVIMHRRGKAHRSFSHTAKL